MPEPIENRYEFLYLFDCENGNPNGDPDFLETSRESTPKTCGGCVGRVPQAPR